MHILAQSGRELDDITRREVTNVRDSLQGTGLANTSVDDSTRKSSWENTSFADSWRSGASSVSMIYTISSSTTKFTILQSIETSYNDAMLTRAFLWLRISVIDQSQYSTIESTLRRKMMFVSLPTRPLLPVIRMIIGSISQIKTMRIGTIASDASQFRQRPESRWWFQHVQ